MIFNTFVLKIDDFVILSSPLIINRDQLEADLEMDRRDLRSRLIILSSIDFFKEINLVQDSKSSRF